MSDYIATSLKGNINWNAKGNERIVQNVNNLLNTFMYEVAYDRILGRNPKNIDKPIEVMKSTLIAETYELIAEYEPRAKPVEVNVNLEDNQPVIKVVLNIE